MPFPLPPDEERRIAALRRYRLLDTEREQGFDDFAELAAQICQTPVALVTFVDSDRQWFKASIGFDQPETPREHSFCSHAILGTEVMIVENALQDPRFAGNPLVTAGPRIRFYAGAPLITTEGEALGSLCVIDSQPRPLGASQKKALAALARQVVTLMELRRTAADLAEALGEVRTLQGLLPICSHCKAVRSDAGYWQTIERYLSEHAGTVLSHSLCPICFERHYPEQFARLKARETSA